MVAANGERKVPDKVKGTVEATLPQGLYRVRCDNGTVVIASLTGIPKQTIVRVIPGDKVFLEVSPLDPGRGRITAKLP